MAVELRKIIIRKGTSAQFDELNLNGGGLDEAEFGFTTDTNQLFIGVGDGQNKEIATATHMEDLSNPHQVSVSQIGAEPEFTKNTAFNKDFGTTEGTVAEGNHGHTFASLIQTPTTLSGYGITDADTSSEVDAKVQALKDTLLNGADTAFDSLYELQLAVQQANLNIGTNEGAIDINAGNINNLQLGIASLSQTVDDNIQDIEDNANAILTKQDNLVFATNYKTVNGVDLFDMGYNNTSGDAYLRRTPERTFVGSASTDDLRDIKTMLIGNNYSNIFGNPYTNYITYGGQNILESVILYQQGAPNNGTAGQIGYWLWDITNGNIYRCVTANPGAIGGGYYTWQLEDSITAYASLNINNELNEDNIYRFSGNGIVTEWEMNLAGGLNTTTSGTLQKVENINAIILYSANLFNYDQLYIRYIYEDSVTGLKHHQFQTIYPEDIGDDLTHTLLFKSLNGNNTTLKRSGFGEQSFALEFAIPATQNDFQQIYVYKLD